MPPCVFLRWSIEVAVLGFLPAQIHFRIIDWNSVSVFCGILRIKSQKIKINLGRIFILTARTRPNHEILNLSHSAKFLWVFFISGDTLRKISLFISNDGTILTPKYLTCSFQEMLITCCIMSLSLLLIWKANTANFAGFILYPETSPKLSRILYKALIDLTVSPTEKTTSSE